MDELMPIGEFSRRSGLSPKRLRSYAAGGLLVPAAVDSSSGYRYYAPGQLREAHVIDALREAGVPLAAIGALLLDPSGDWLDAWTQRVEIDAVQRREALDVARRLLVVEATPSPTHGDRPTGKEDMTTLRTASRTDTGRVRDSNQDAMVTTACLTAVADGMGGGPGGDVAAALAVSLVEAGFTGRSLDELEAAVRAANRAIWDRAEATEGWEGMGTTVCAAGLTADGMLAVVHVGDSRAYLVRDRTLTPLTEDHSVTAEAVRRGEMTEQEALVHPHRSVLTRAVGIGRDVELDSSTTPVAQGDRLLLCTDGLFNEVSDDEIASILTAATDLPDAAATLVDLALAHGGRDNVTVVVADVTTSPATSPAPPT